MKVELLVNLKVSTGKIISAGSVFSDEEGTPIPEFVMRRLQRRQARVIPGTPKPIVPEKELPPSLLPKTKKTKEVEPVITNKPVAGKTKGIAKKTIEKKGK